MDNSQQPSSSLPNQENKKHKNKKYDNNDIKYDKSSNNNFLFPENFNNAYSFQHKNPYDTHTNYIVPNTYTETIDSNKNIFTDNLEADDRPKLEEFVEESKENVRQHTGKQKINLESLIRKLKEV